MPSKTLLRPGEALADARRVPGAREAVTGDLDAAEALGWRDYMVSDYDDASAAEVGEEARESSSSAAPAASPAPARSRSATTPTPPSTS